MNRTLISDLATGLVVTCALLVTAAVLKRELASKPAGPDLRPRRVTEWPALVSAGRWLGRSDAPVRIVEFSDFQCPFCARTHPAVEAVRRRHPDRVAVLFRHFPLDGIHPYARQAAVASECAGEQGAFEAYSNALFAQQDSIGSKSWSQFAAEAGVRDSAAFGRCVAEMRPAANVDRDVRAGQAVRIEVTPTLVINGVLYPGAVTETELERLISRADTR
jgi:protein-disulfide isomerase